VRLISEDTFGIITVWAESRGEPFRGQQAVAEVIQRRALKKFFSDGTIAGTVLRPYQFSCWSSKDPNFVGMLRLDDKDALVTSCTEAWDAAMEGPAIVPGANSYFNPTIVTPTWSISATLIADIGKHRFVKV
jgi:N-acetylmuramoyl-L-alanine amidase